MSHQITENDAVYSTNGTEWHGLAIHTDITEKEIADLSPPMKQDKLSIGGVEFPDHSGIYADTSEIERIESDIVPISIMSANYGMIENEKFFEAMQNALSDISKDYTFTTAGTISNLQTVFASIMLDSIEINGHKENIMLNALNNHSGKHHFQVFPSSVRIVCANTVRFALDQAESMIKIRHTKHASLEIEGLSGMIEAMLNGADEYKYNMETLAEMEISYARQKNLIAGILAESVGLKDETPLSGTMYNRIQGIVELAKYGKGNHGKTIYDLAQGVTDFFSNGAGVGNPDTRKAGKAAFSSNFGTGADQKENITSRLFQTQDHGQLARRGERVLQVTESYRETKGQKLID